MRTRFNRRHALAVVGRVGSDQPERRVVIRRVGGSIPVCAVLRQPGSRVGEVRVDVYSGACEKNTCQYNCPYGNTK